jgi:hypothetical protein
MGVKASPLFVDGQVLKANTSDVITNSNPVGLNDILSDALSLSQATSQTVTSPLVLSGGLSGSGVNTISGFDDPTNASGLGAPAIIRGTVYAHLAAGVTVGAGQTTGVRQATATGLQNAINYAAANNKIFQINEGVYEINSSTGLVIPANHQATYNWGFTWKGGGHGSTQIVQFYNGGTGAPVLTIGDTTGVNEFYEIDVEGALLGYGISQSGLTSSTALVVGSMAWGVISRIQVTGPFPGYDGILLTGGIFSSMAMRDVVIGPWQRHGLNIVSSGSGNHYDNVYMSAGGVGSPGAISGNYIYTIQNLEDQLFSRLNCEWGQTNCVIFLGGNNTEVYAGHGYTFNALHVEGVTLTGADPCIFDIGGNATMAFNGFDLTSTQIKAANFTGTASMMRLTNNIGYGSSVIMNGLCLNEYTASNVTTSFKILRWMYDSSIWDDQSNFQINAFRIVDQPGSNLIGHIYLDEHLPIASFNTPAGFARYSYGAKGSKIENAAITVSATYTHYGQHEDATILVPASITGFTLTLSNLMGATGTQPVRTGNTVRVRRIWNTVSGTLLIKDDAGTTLITNTTSNVDYWFVFNGTHYVAFTPVS